jgi:hypothetical protein
VASTSTRAASTEGAALSGCREKRPRRKPRRPGLACCLSRCNASTNLRRAWTACVGSNGGSGTGAILAAVPSSGSRSSRRSGCPRAHSSHDRRPAMASSTQAARTAAISRSAIGAFLLQEVEYKSSARLLYSEEADQFSPAMVISPAGGRARARRFRPHHRRRSLQPCRLHPSTCQNARLAPTVTFLRGPSRNPPASGLRGARRRGAAGVRGGAGEAGAPGVPPRRGVDAAAAVWWDSLE